MWGRHVPALKQQVNVSGVSDRAGQKGVKRSCERQNEDARVIYGAPSTAKHDNETLLGNWA